MLHTAEARTGQTVAISPVRTEKTRVTREQAAAYLDSLKRRGCTEETIKTYRRNLLRFLHMLPPDGAIDRGTVARWRDVLLASGYKPRTVNVRLSAANGFLGYLGLREYQLPVWLAAEDEAQPELTRNEYLRLLSAARALGKERTYLLVKVFAATGLAIHELPQLTAGAVHAGRITVETGRARRIIRLPACLRAELERYIQRAAASPDQAVFVTQSGKPLSRTSVTASIQSLSHDARVSPEKCNPRCLRKLYQATQAGIRASIALLAEQNYERLLEQEQLAIGWGEVNGR